MVVILTDIHPVLSEVTKFGTFEDNLNLKCAWGRFAIKSDTEIWNYCLRLSLQKKKQITVEYLEEFIPKRFNRHIESGNCVVDGCDQHRTLLINMTSLFLDENRKLKRFYRTLYCSYHFKQYRQFF